MDEMFDAFGWKDMGTISDMIGEFTEDEMEFLGIEKDSDEWKDEDVDTFGEDD